MTQHAQGQSLKQLNNEATEWNETFKAKGKTKTVDQKFMYANRFS